MRNLSRIGLYLLFNALVLLMIGWVLLFLDLGAKETQYLFIFFIIYGVAGSFLSFLFSKSIAKSALGIRLVDSSHPDARLHYLHKVVSEMAKEKHIAMPELGVYNSYDANAFAIGTSKNNTLLVFSSQILEELSGNELAAVAAHEIAHITQGDMLTMALLGAVINVFSMFFIERLAYVLNMLSTRRVVRFYQEPDSLYYVEMPLQCIVLFLAMIPACALSRQREYKADKSAALLVGKQSMIDALLKLDRFHQPRKEIDAFIMVKIYRESRGSLYSTHPRLQERIKRIEAL